MPPKIWCTMVIKPVSAPRLLVPKLSDTNTTVSGAVTRKVAPNTRAKIATETADWSTSTSANTTTRAANASAVGLDKLGQNGVLYHGLAVMGGGSILGGLVLGAIAVFVIERQFMRRPLPRSS